MKYILSLALLIVMNNSKAQQLAFFNQTGKPICYLESDANFYDYEGNPLAYLKGNIVYTYKGSFVGWLENGLIRDKDGAVSCFTKNSGVTVFTTPEPFKAYKKLAPYKSYTEPEPFKPFNQQKWASLEFTTNIISVDNKNNDTQSEPYRRKIPNNSAEALESAKRLGNYNVDLVAAATERYLQDAQNERNQHIGEIYKSPYGWLNQSEYDVITKNENDTKLVNDILIKKYLESLPQKKNPLKKELRGWKKVSVMPWSSTLNVSDASQLIYTPEWTCQFKKGRFVRVRERNSYNNTRTDNYYQGTETKGKYFISIGDRQVYLILTTLEPTNK